MADDEDVRIYPMLVDTGAFIAVANTDLWGLLTEHIALSTTDVVVEELQRHVEENRESAPKGTREHRLHHGSAKTLNALDDPDIPFTVVEVPAVPSGADAGERSLRMIQTQHPKKVDLIALMDLAARDRIRNDIRERGVNARVVPPSFLFFILLDSGVIDTSTFCEATEEMLLNEGWTGYQVVQAAWEGIPVDCSEHIDRRVLP